MKNGKINLDEKIKIALDKKVYKDKRIFVLEDIFKFCTLYQTFKRRQSWEQLEPPIEKAVQAVLLLLEDENPDIVGRILINNIPCYDMRIVKKLIEILKNHSTKYGAYEYWNVKYTLKGLILRKIKEGFKHSLYPYITKEKKKEFILDLVKERVSTNSKKIEKILDFLEPDICQPLTERKDVEREKENTEKLAYNEPELEKNLGIIIDIVDDYINKKIESPEFKEWIRKRNQNKKTSIEKAYGARKCKICGKVFGEKKYLKEIYNEVTGMKFTAHRGTNPSLNLGAQWECLCNHIAELLYGKILTQERLVNRRIPDIIIDDGSVKFDHSKRISYANKIIEVKLSPDLQADLRNSILKYIDFCNSMEFWLCYELEQEELDELFEKQLKYFEKEKRKSNKREATAAEGFYEEEIKWIKKTRDIVGNKKVTLIGWIGLLKELKNRNAIKLIEMMKEIVKEYEYSFIGYKYRYDRNSPEIQKEIEKRFNEVLWIKD